MTPFRLKRAALLAGLALLIGACAAVGGSPASSLSASPTAGTTESATTFPASTDGGGRTHVLDLAVGDCFSATGIELSRVDVVPCDEVHVYEVFAVFDHPAAAGEPYPGDQEILQYADGECRAPFADYVGIDYLDSEFFITSITPSRETWEAGDRQIVCTLNLQDQVELTTSARGSER